MKANGATVDRVAVVSGAAQIDLDKGLDGAPIVRVDDLVANLADDLSHLRTAREWFITCMDR
jgi:hypothetical protein